MEDFQIKDYKIGGLTALYIESAAGFLRIGTLESTDDLQEFAEVAKAFARWIGKAPNIPRTNNGMAALFPAFRCGWEFARGENG